MIDLVSAFRAVVDALESVEIDYLVVGSMAAAAWGVARTTRDVDLVALMSAGDVQHLLRRLDADSFYVPADDAVRAGQDGGSFNVLHTTSGGKVDVFVARHDDEFTRSRMERKVRSEVFGCSGMDRYARGCCARQAQVAAGVEVGGPMAGLYRDRRHPGARRTVPQALGPCARDRRRSGRAHRQTVEG